jgi:hypothetical protein
LINLSQHIIRPDFAEQGYERRMMGFTIMTLVAARDTIA